MKRLLSKLFTLLSVVCLVIGCMTPMLAKADSDGTTYQWYEAVYEPQITVKPVPTEPVNGKILALPEQDYFTETDGVWSSYYEYLGVKLPIQANDVIRVIPSSGYSGTVNIPAIGATFTKDENGVYSFTYTRTTESAAGVYMYSDDGEFTTQIQIVRGDSTYPVVNAFGKIYDNEVYANVSYGTYENGAWYTDSDNEISLKVYAQAGQIMQVVLPEDVEASVKIGGKTVTGTNGVYQMQIQETKTYDISAECDNACAAEISLGEYVPDSAIEGQTSKELTEAEHGGIYICKVTDADGTENYTDFVTVAYQITEQPTVSNPTVGVNYETGISYQWYETKTELIEVTEENAEYVYGGEYDSDEGLWYHEDNIDIEIPLKKDETLVVTMPEGFEGYVGDYYADDSFAQNTSGAYVYTATKAEVMNLYIYNTADDTGVYADIQVANPSLADAVAGETSETLVNGEYGKSYACKVTWECGVEELSSVVTMTAAISKQPTASVPTVEINFPEQAATYQWYAENKEILPFTSHDGETENGVLYGSCNTGSYEDGVWKSEDQYLEVVVMAEAGDKVYFTPTDNGEISFTDVRVESALATLAIEDGSYVYYVEESGSLGWGAWRDTDYSITITLVKADNTTYEVKAYDYEAANEMQTTYVTGAYTDGSWSSMYNEFAAAEWISFDFEAKAGDFIKITPSAGFAGDVMIGDYSTYEIVTLEENDGVYLYEVTSDGNYTIGVMADDEFSMQAVVERYVLHAVAGQTTDTLCNHKAGTYACVVTLKDGTTLTSDMITITDADITHIYDDEYDADCNVCGAVRDVPKRPNEVPDMGDTNLIFYYVGLMLLGAGCVVIAKKKYLR